MGRGVERTLSLSDTICFRVTRKCNLNCPFCLASFPMEDLSLKDLLLAVDRLRKRGMKTIKLSGGEPTLRKDLADIVEYCVGKGLETILYSNILNVSDKLIEKMAELEIMVKPSLHGIGEIHDEVVGTKCFKRVVTNLKRMKNRDIPLNPRCTINKINLAYYQDLIDFCINLGIGQLSFCVFIPRERGYQNEERYSLTPEERDTFVERILYHKKSLEGVVEIKYKELWYTQYYVFEPDGFLWGEREFDKKDVRIERII